MTDIPPPNPEEWNPINGEIRRQHRVPKQIIDRDGLDRFLTFLTFIDSDVQRLKEAALAIKEESDRLKRLRSVAEEHYAPQIKILYKSGQIPMAGKSYVSEFGHKVSFSTHKNHIKKVELLRPIEELHSDPELARYVIVEDEPKYKFDLKAFKESLENASQAGDGYPVDDPRYKVIEQPELTVKF